MSNSQDFKWYTICVQPKMEDSIMKKITSLAEKIFPDTYNDHIGDFLIPKSSSFAIKDGEKKEIKNTLYPGYIFAKLNMSLHLKSVIQSVDGVRSFISDAESNPKPMGQKEYENLLSSIQIVSNKAAMLTVFQIGDRVKVKNGAFEGFEGIVVKVNKEQEQLSIKVKMFGSEMDVESNFNGVSKVTE